MRDDYLWDRSGEPDAELKRLEKALSPLAEGGRALELPADAATARVAILARGDRMLLWREPRLLLAAASLLVVGGFALWTFRPSSGPAFAVARIEGTPRIGVWGIRDQGTLGEGQTLVTDAKSRARVQVGAIGEVTLDPGSRLRLLRVVDTDHRMSLERGVLHAFIVAPPRHFTVETPAVNAVDLGCAYTLEVGKDGRSMVTVETGWVSFERGGREAFIPAGARCVTMKGRDPGTPHFADADTRLIEGLAVLDEALASQQGTALDAVLEHARAEDALTLWHLLARLEGEARSRVYERLAALAPPPEGVTREAVLAGERAALDRYWNSLGLGDVDWWRLWAQDPPERS